MSESETKYTSPIEASNGYFDAVYDAAISIDKVVGGIAPPLVRDLEPWDLGLEFGQIGSVLALGTVRMVVIPTSVGTVAFEEQVVLKGHFPKIHPHLPPALEGFYHDRLDNDWGLFAEFIGPLPDPKKARIQLLIEQMVSTEALKQRQLTAIQEAGVDPMKTVKSIRDEYLASRAFIKGE